MSVARRTFCHVTLLDVDTPTAPTTGLGQLEARVDVDVSRLSAYAEVPFVDLLRRQGHATLVTLRLDNVAWMAGKEPADYLPDGVELVHVGARMKQAADGKL